MPSTTSSSVSRLFASSTVMTPSLPTFCMALARKSPISRSPLAEMVPTWAISSLEVTFFEFFLRSSTMVSTARSTPRFKSIGFMPAATALAPSLTIAWASTVAVVVPSPARSEVLLATSRTICAPMFSNLSSSSISLATVTPSLVMRGAPNDLSSTTLRPLGPRVTFTALARMSTPRSMRSRASTENLTSFAAIVSFPSVFAVTLRSEPRERRASKGDRDCGCHPSRRVRRARTFRMTVCALRRLLPGGGAAFDDAHDVGLLHDQELFAVDLDLGARPFAEQDDVTDLEVDRNELAVFIAAAGADGDDLALARLLLGGVGDDDAAGGLFLGIDTLDDDAVVKRTELHGSPPNLLDSQGFSVTGWSPRPVPGAEVGGALWARKGPAKNF